MKAEVKVPAVGESITEATIGEWLKKNGDFVRRDEVLLSLETDKASVEVVAENEGKLEISVDEGETIEIGAVVATIDTSASAPAGEASAPKEAQAASAGNGQAQSSAGTGPSAHPELQKSMSPAVGRVAHERGLDPANIQGTGRGGRITKEDAMKAPVSQQPAPAAPQAKKSEIPPLPQARSGGSQGQQRREPMSTLRKRIAERLVQSQQTAAILTTFNEVDMTNLIETRAKYKEQFKEKYGVSLGFMGFFTKAAVQALREFPAVNAFIEGNDMVFNDFFNIGVAVGTPKGLVVPVVRDADQLSVAEIELAIRHYALKARDGKIGLDDLTGGTFTISNGGVYGSLMSTPIINPPQSGILGMHKMEERPVAINGKVEVRTMMYLALSYDHRIIDGKEAVSFLVRIKECIEDPQRLLLEI